METTSVGLFKKQYSRATSLKFWFLYQFCIIRQFTWLVTWLEPVSSSIQRRWEFSSYLPTRWSQLSNEKEKRKIFVNTWLPSAVSPSSWHGADWFFSVTWTCRSPPHAVICLLLSHVVYLNPLRKLLLLPVCRFPTHSPLCRKASFKTESNDPHPCLKLFNGFPLSPGQTPL